MLTIRILIGILTSLCLFVCAVSTRAGEVSSQPDYVPFEGEKSTWHDGFERFDFIMDG